MTSTAEQLIYATTRITGFCGGNEIGVGTGFYFAMQFQNDKNLIVLVTNKHVLDGCDFAHLKCHVAGANGPSGETIDVRVEVSREYRIDHPSPEVDLTAVVVSHLFNEAERKGKRLFFRLLTDDLIPSEVEWERIDAIEDIIMIGCPEGIYDSFNNSPVVRRGITATSLNSDYEGQKEFMVDIACFNGSSGSPIFLFDKYGYVDRLTNTYLPGRTRKYLVGILFAGPFMSQEGEVSSETDFSVTLRSTMHLGYAIKATELRAITQVLKKQLEHSIHQVPN